MKVNVTVTTETTKAIELTFPAFWHHRDDEYLFGIFYRADKSGQVDTIIHNSDGWEYSSSYNTPASFSRWLGGMLKSESEPCEAKIFYDALAEMRGAIDKVQMAGGE